MNIQLAVLILMATLVLLVLYLPSNFGNFASARRLQVATGYDLGPNHSGVEFAYSLPQLLGDDNVNDDYHPVHR